MIFSQTESPMLDISTPVNSEEEDDEARGSDEGIAKVDIPMCEIILGWIIILVIINECDLCQVPGHQHQVHHVRAGESPQVVEGGGVELLARQDDKISERASQA